MEFVRDLDWHTLRLGAFHVLAHVGERSVDTREALLHRFEAILFHKVYCDDQTYRAFAAFLDQDTLSWIRRRAEKVRPNPAAEVRIGKSRFPGIMPSESKTPWFYTVELWQADHRLPAGGIGSIAPDHAFRYLDLGIKLGIFTPTNALSERGETLRAFYDLKHGQIDCRSPDPNPLYIDTLASKVVFLDALLREDVLTILMLTEFVDDPDAGIARAFRKVNGESRPELLLRAAKHLYDILGVEPDIHTALELQQLNKYIENISRKKNHLNQALPRMEFAVDLGLVDRCTVGRRTSEPVYRPTDTTRRFVETFARFKSDPTTAQNELDSTFFNGMANTYGLPAEPILTDDELLLWFCRGYKLVKRPAGFTPGRSAAFAGALLALEHRKVVELKTLFAAVYRAPKGPWAGRLGFSGGSRFDTEFLIRVDDRLEGEIEGAIA